MSSFDAYKSTSLMVFFAVVGVFLLLCVFVRKLFDTMPFFVYIVFLMCFFTAFQTDGDSLDKFGGYIAIAGLTTWTLWMIRWWKARSATEPTVFQQVFPSDDIAFVLTGTIAMYLIFRLYGSATEDVHSDVFAGVLAVGFATWFLFWRISMYMPYIQTNKGLFIRSAVAYEPNFS